MKVLKKISAMKARQNLGQLLNEVSIRGDAYIIERAGKPLAALVDMERFQQLQEDRDAALRAVKNIWQKMQEADPGEIRGGPKGGGASHRGPPLTSRRPERAETFLGEGARGFGPLPSSQTLSPNPRYLFFLTNRPVPIRKKGMDL